MDYKLFLISSLLHVIIVTGHQARNLTIYEQLVSDILEVYDTRAFPATNEGERVTVNINLALYQILDVVETEEVLRAHVWKYLYWEDKRLSWDPLDYNGISSISIPSTSVWTPDIVLYNDVREEARDIERFEVRVLANGVVTWETSVAYKSVCKMNVRYFPLDIQECPLIFGSWVHDGNSLDIVNGSENGNIDSLVKSGEWDLLSFKAIREEKYYSCCPEPYPSVTYFLRIARKSEYYVVNVVIPIVILNVVTIFSFLLPAESGEKVSMSVTVLLSQTVFGIVVIQYMPTTSEYVPMLGIYMIWLLSVLAIATILNVFVVSIHFRGLHGTEVPDWVKKWIIFKLSHVLCMHSASDVMRIQYAVDQMHTYQEAFRKLSTAMITASYDDVRTRNKRKESLHTKEDKELSHHQLNTQLLEEMKKLNQHTQDSQKSDIMQVEWKITAAIIDRLFFVIFVIMLLANNLYLYLSIKFPLGQ